MRIDDSRQDGHRARVTLHITLTRRVQRDSGDRPPPRLRANRRAAAVRAAGPVRCELAEMFTLPGDGRGAAGGRLVASSADRSGALVLGHAVDSSRLGEL